MPTIRTDGESFLLTIESPVADASHTVAVPVDRPDILVRILLREQEPAARRTLGTEASPTQYMVDAWLKANEPRVDIRAARAKRKELEERYGVNLEEIEI